jgi:HK97 family phage major capsid protein
MLLTQIEAEKKAALAQADTVMGKATAEDRPLTEEERASVQEHLAKADEYDARLKAGRTDVTLRERLETFRSPATPPMPKPADQAAGREVVARTWGQQVTASVIGEAIKAGAFRRRFDSSLVELKALETLTGITAPAGGAGLLVPDYVRGILPQLFQPPTVRAILLNGQTDSVYVKYPIESLATNNAAAVLEGGDKPQSVLRFTQTTDEVKKIATWIAVSNEMLDDVPALQSYIDGRLRVFIAQEVDDQLLNGDGIGANILGIRNRIGLTADVTQGGSESAIDAIHRQITAIMAASYVMPDGLVIHPSDWESVVLTKATGSGTYLGANPFAPVQSRTLWGLRVVVTTQIPAGTSLVGAFGSMAQFFTRGGVSVDMSNSHDDFFIKNLVAIRAEERGALAVYRPSAFGEVILTGGESA